MSTEAKVQKAVWPDYRVHPHQRTRAFVQMHVNRALTNWRWYSTGEGRVLFADADWRADYAWREAVRLCACFETPARNHWKVEVQS